MNMNLIDHDNGEVFEVVEKKQFDSIEQKLRIVDFERDKAVRALKRGMEELYCRSPLPSGSNTLIPCMKCHSCVAVSQITRIMAEKMA